ncbi:MAG: FAD:protein FMN transferase [Rubripirellula sp.]
MESENPALLTHVSRRAMATEFVVILPAAHADAVEVAVSALELLDSIEQSLTIYRPDSEISRVNRMAFAEPVPVSDATFQLMQRAIRWSQRTNGGFDVTAGPLVEAWGFTTRSGKKPTEQAIEQARQRVGYEKIELSEPDRSVRFAAEGMSINLGAIGKGDALDQVAARLHRDGLHDFLIHGGNSSIIAAGDQVVGSELGWPVGVAHPTKPKHRLAGIRLRNQAIATSGSGKQFFHHRGRRYGHVIDPRTGYPAGDLLSLTVLMERASDADACATGLFVEGSERTENFTVDEVLLPLVRVRAGLRQDSVSMDWQGEIHWVETPDDAVSR